MTSAILVGLLAAAGTWLVLQRDLVRVVFGFSLIAHAANVLLLSASSGAGRVPPIVGQDGTLADPLPQAFVLTAIVISLGVTALLVALVVRQHTAPTSTDSEEGER